MQINIDPQAFGFPDIPLPKLWTVHQKVDAPVLADVEGAAREAARALFADPRLKPGATVAVGVGSRGISNLQTVVRAVIKELKRYGCEPFIVPAMGSHGGATPEGQTQILGDYGITPEHVGAPIRATMSVAQVGALDDGYPVYFDCNALSADAVLVINRIKPHTDFSGEIESGIAKMCAIGLGKQKGAATIHRFGAEGLRHIMPKVARKLVESVNIVGGVALIENQYGETAEIHALNADEVGNKRENALLKRSYALLPRLPFEQIDVLIIDEMGKNISGSGLDTHVIGRVAMPSVPETEWDGPSVRIVCVLNLSEQTHGNAAGFGLADMVTQQLMERVDFETTMVNHRTSQEGGVYRGKIPIILEDADSCVRAAIATCGRGLPETVRLVRIRNTKYIDTFEVSAPLLDELRARSDQDIAHEPHAPNFDMPLTH